MTGLRFFEDTMLRQIEIERNAREYLAECASIRRELFPRTDNPHPDFHKATEGLNAVRIIMGPKQ